ncbi:hypothetical protein GCU56_22655 [Geodermatophilus sabuli]|uniref:Uncharacterized protein n=1 Tax=Geodermatophilus sabuli TaxID=1564158 RepID=A0A7K3W7B6_9ACTN|nr:hypothetical protein [Geodermatophilus sabuli]NEK60661.1 hypothetical protein [Geodermatophilus sabuli]
MAAPTADRALAWYSSAIALPYPDVRSALTGLRAEIAHEAARTGAGVPDWDTEVLVGPVLLPTSGGQPWFDYVLSVACRPRDARQD